MVLLGRRSFPRDRPWLIFVLLATAGACAWCGTIAYRSGQWPRGSSIPGLCLGGVGFVLILFEFLLWPRKKVRAWRIGHAQTWLRAHIWLGLLSLPIVVLHSGFRLGSQLTTALLVLFLLVIASGIVGLTLQQFLPRWMLDYVPAETIYSQIDFVARQYALNAEDLIIASCGRDPEGRRLAKDAPPTDSRNVDASEKITVGAMRKVGSVQGYVLLPQSIAEEIPNAALLRDTFYTRIAPYLEFGARRGRGLHQPSQAKRLFEMLRQQLDAAAHDVVDALEGLCEQRRQFDVQARLHFWLHSWLWVHVPLSAALLVLLLVHAYLGLKYL